MLLRAAAWALLLLPVAARADPTPSTRPGTTNLALDWFIERLSDPTDRSDPTDPTDPTDDPTDPSDLTDQSDRSDRSVQFQPLRNADAELAPLIEAMRNITPAPRRAR